MEKLKSTTVLILACLLSSVIHAQTKTVYMEGHDNMKFTVEKITAKPGTQIELTLKTVSSQPAAQMAHNFVLLKKDTDVNTFITMGQREKDNEYIHPSMENQIIAATGMLAGGEKETITFTAPQEKGKYEYVCTFPAHYFSGMKGFLVVE